LGRLRDMEDLKQKESPPKWAVRFFRWYCNDHLSEAVLGDMLELYVRRKKKLEKRKADLLFLWNVLCFLQPFALKRKSSPQNNIAMFENYLKIAWRIMSRQKMYAGIKIGGFAVGIASCLLIALLIRQELSYDRHYQNTGRIFRIYRESTLNGEFRKGVHFPAPFAKALQEDFPEIESAGHLNAGEYFGAGNNELRRIDQTESLHEEGFIYADQNLINILEIPFIKGNPINALTEPNSILITERKATRYFRNEDPLNKILILNNDDTRQYKVTGVIKDFPVTSHLQSDFMMTLAGKEFWKGEQTTWAASNYLDYIVVRPGTTISQLEDKLQRIIGKYFLPDAMESKNDNAIKWAKSLHLKLQPITDIYLNRYQIGEGAFDGFEHGDIRYLWLFGSIASFILVIACINFINLSTAKSANRGKEVGLRKVVGSQRQSLIKQFLTESSLLSLISFLLGLALARVALPYFNSLMVKSLIFPWQEWWLIPVLLGGSLTIGLLAGFYPSIYLSSFLPAQVLKGNLSLGKKSTSFRSMLVVFQFTVSIVLIVATLIVSRQMNYILTKKVGFDKDQVLILQDTHTMGDKIQTFKKELMRLPEVKHASITGFLPIIGMKRNGNPFWLDGKKDTDQGVQGQMWSVDPDYVTTMGIKIIEGRDFLESISDQQSMIINKEMARELNLTDPIGVTIVNPWNQKWTVIGVIDDFNYESLKSPIKPLSIVLKNSTNMVLVKINSKEIQQAIQSITTVWKQFSPNQSIRYTFLDQSYAAMYADVARTGKFFTVFSFLAIMVACLGLFALSAFIVEQRSKEISVRIILGAKTENIVHMLTKNFVKLVMTSFLIAVPVSAYLMSQWLQEYAYRIELKWDVFVLAGLISIFIALFTVSFQSIRAAIANPSQSLRSE